MKRKEEEELPYFLGVPPLAMRRTLGRLMRRLIPSEVLKFVAIPFPISWLFVFSLSTHSQYFQEIHKHCLQSMASGYWGKEKFEACEPFGQPPAICCFSVLPALPWATIHVPAANCLELLSQSPNRGWCSFHTSQTFIKFSLQSN